MGTRCQIHITTNSKALNITDILLYRHWDGNPENIIPVIHKAYTLQLEKLEDTISRARLNDASRGASVICSGDPMEFEIENGLGLHGDIDFLYRVEMGRDLENWLVSVYQPTGEFHKERAFFEVSKGGLADGNGSKFEKYFRTVSAPTSIIDLIEAFPYQDYHKLENEKVIITLYEGNFNVESKPDGLEIILRKFIDHPEGVEGIDFEKDKDGIEYLETIL